MTTGTLFNVAADGRTFWLEPELPFDDGLGGRSSAEVVVVIPCSGPKAPIGPLERRPAGELYTGTFHRYARHHAARLGADRVLILSALHGLIELDHLIAAYDVTIGDPNALGSRPGIVRNQAAGLGVTRVVSFCPNRYTEVLVAAGLDVIAPLAGSRGIGEQRGRLARLTALA